jgi:hypothetical protein
MPRGKQERRSGRKDREREDREEDRKGARRESRDREESDREDDRGGKRGKRGKSEFVRLTQMFESRNGGRIGSVREEYLDNLQDLVEKAQDAGKGVAFFLKRWGRDENPVLSATIAQDYKKGGRRGKARDEEGDHEEEDRGNEDGDSDYDI